MKMQKQKLLNLIELPFFKPISEIKKLCVGRFIRLECKVQEGTKERAQIYEGLIIAMQNRKNNQTVTIRRKVHGIGMEQIFFTNSPKILAISILAKFRVRRARLFFTRGLNTKAIRLKAN